MKKLKSFIISIRKKVLTAPIRFYQKHISPAKPTVCRFYPSCSAYAAEAIVRFGFIGGGLMAFCRILRCNPLCRGGYDPVPVKFSLMPFAGAKEQKNGIFPKDAVKK